jgi:hypothetical protein
MELVGLGNTMIVTNFSQTFRGHLCRGYIRLLSQGDICNKSVLKIGVTHLLIWHFQWHLGINICGPYTTSFFKRTTMFVYCVFRCGI